MKRWYEFYYESDAIRQRPVDEFVNGENVNGSMVNWRKIEL